MDNVGMTCQCRSFQLCGSRGRYHKPYENPHCYARATVKVDLGGETFAFCDGCVRDDDNIVGRFEKEMPSEY